jgi:type IV pilus assembly protein PilC
MNGIDIKHIQLSKRDISRDDSVSPDFSKFLSKEITWFGKKFSSKRKEWFYSELSILLSAGVDIRAALDLIIEETTKAREKKLIESIREDVVSGSSISHALRQHSEFSSYEYHSIEIGEETGQLDEVLKELSTFYSSQVKLQRQVVSTLTYPLITILFAVGTLALMLGVVVPMFKDMFKQLGADLPESTKLVMYLSGVFLKYGTIILLLLTAVGVYLYSQRRKKWFRSFFSKILLKVPVLGTIIAKVYLTRFCQSMKLLLNAKTKLIDAIDLVEKMIDFYPLEIALKEMQQDLLKGSLLNESMIKHSIFPARVTSLIKVAEETNKNEVIFERLAKQLSEEVDHQNAVLSKLIEPLFVVFLGVVVGFILIAMYMPMFQLSTAVGQ